MTYPKISYSGLERWERCNLQWLLNKNKKRRQVDPEYVVDGNAMHAGLEAIISGMPDDAIAAALRYWTMRVREDAVRWDESEKREHFNRVGTGMERLIGLVEELDQRAVKFPRMLSEIKVVHVGKGWAMEGVFDLVFEPVEDRGIEVWDLKTGQWHKDQLVFYDLLAEMGLGARPTRLGIIEPFGQGLVEIPVTEEMREDMRARIQTMAMAVAAGQFPKDFPATGYPSACGWCRSKPWCPKWEQARSGRLE